MVRWSVGEFHDGCVRCKGGEHHPRTSPTLQEGQIYPRQLSHGGWKEELQSMGWYASTEGREGPGGVGLRCHFLQINNPCNKTFSFHLQIISCQHGNDDLNLESMT